MKKSTNIVEVKSTNVNIRRTDVWTYHY